MRLNLRAAAAGRCHQHCGRDGGGGRQSDLRLVHAPPPRQGQQRPAAAAPGAEPAPGAAAGAQRGLRGPRAALRLLLGRRGAAATAAGDHKSGLGARQVGRAALHSFGMGVVSCLLAGWWARSKVALRAVPPACGRWCGQRLTILVCRGEEAATPKALHPLVCFGMGVVSCYPRGAAGSTSGP